MAGVRRAGVLGVLLLGTLLVPAAASFGAVQSTLYVNNTDGSGCSDSGPGTRATPYCTIQAAANVVVGGQTVDVVGAYGENVVLTRSGSADAPITFTTDQPNQTSVFAGSAASPTFTVSGAHDVRVTGLSISGAGSSAAVDVSGAAARVVFDDVFLSTGPDNRIAPVVHIGSQAGTVTVSRATVQQSFGPDVVVDPGSRDDVIAGNLMFGSGNQGIVLNGATGTDIVNNTVLYACDHAVSVTGTVTGAHVENNILAYAYGPDVYYTCPAQTDPVAELAVDATAAHGVSASYNMVYPVGAASADYLWAGTAYPSSAAFQAAVGQGTHDIDTDPGLNTSSYYPWINEGSAAIDSGDANAPGVPRLSFYDQPRVDDPNVANTGTGTFSYLDRGAVELGDGFVDRTLTASASQAPVGGTVHFTGDYTDAWQEPFTCDYNFGDGHTAKNRPCTATHAYASPGTYQVSVTPHNAALLTATDTVTVKVVPAGGALTPTLTDAATGALAVTSTVTGGTDPWNIASVTYDFGDGTAPVTSAQASWYHVYPRPGTFVVKATVTDAAGAKQSVSHPFTTAGTEFVAVTPVRVTGTAKTEIPSRATTTVPVAGRATIPTGIAAVAVNLTAVNPTTPGTVTAWADGTNRPSTTNLRFSAGHTAANETFVEVGADGSIDLYNDSPAPVLVTADVVGYFTRQARGDRFREVQPTHLADTRSGLGTPAGQVQPNAPRVITVAGVSGLPGSGIDAVALSVAATAGTAPGTVTVYPDGGTVPRAGALAYGKGATTANLVIVPVGTDGKIDIAVSAPADVVVDVAGYFATNVSCTFVPVRPVRNVSSLAVPAHGTAEGDLTKGIANVSTTTCAISGTVTVQGGSAAGNMTVFEQTGEPVPDTYELYWRAKQWVSAGVVTPVLQGLNGVVPQGFSNNSAAPVTVSFDVSGYFAATYY